MLQLKPGQFCIQDGRLAQYKKITPYAPQQGRILSGLRSNAFEGWFLGSYNTPITFQELLIISKEELPYAKGKKQLEFIKEAFQSLLKE